MVPSNVTVVTGDEENPLPKPIFVFGKKFETEPISLNPEKASDAVKKPFTINFADNLQKKEETKVSNEVFGSGFKTEAKMFSNKNLFANPMIKPIQHKHSDLTQRKSKIKLVTEEFERNRKSSKPVDLSKQKTPQSVQASKKKTSESVLDELKKASKKL